jgi:hypothetical protein
VSFFGRAFAVEGFAPPPPLPGGALAPTHFFITQGGAAIACPMQAQVRQAPLRIDLAQPSAAYSDSGGLRPPYPPPLRSPLAGGMGGEAPHDLSCALASAPQPSPLAAAAAASGLQRSAPERARTCCSTPWRKNPPPGCRCSCVRRAACCERPHAAPPPEKCRASAAARTTRTPKSGHRSSNILLVRALLKVRSNSRRGTSMPGNTAASPPARRSTRSNELATDSRRAWS